MVNKRIPKAFFKRNFDLTLSERKLLDDPNIILQIYWMASIRPEQSNIPSFINETETFEEVQIITVQIVEKNFEKWATKVIELIQKYLPYHLVLFVYSEMEFILHCALKKINQNDSSRRTIEKVFVTEKINPASPVGVQQLFLNSLGFYNLNKSDLKEFYDSYCIAITGLRTSNITGEYEVRPLDRSKNDVTQLDEIRKLELEIMALQNQVKKETQLNVQVQINSEVQYRRKKIETLKNILK